MVASMGGQMMRRTWILTGILLLAAAGSLRAGGAPHPRIREGNRAYDAEDYVGAEVGFRKALEAEAELPEGRFDLGDALYRQGRFEPAAGEFERAGRSAGAALQADASYNRGNALFRQQKYPESIEAYADALRADPAHEDARYNLAVARRRLRAQQQQNDRSDGEKETGGDEGKTDRHRDSNPSPDESSPEDRPDAPREPGQDPTGKTERPQTERPPESPEESGPEAAENRAESGEANEPDDRGANAGEPRPGEPAPAREISQAEAERILQAVRDDEKDVQRRLRERTGGRVDVEKDW